MRLVGEGNGGLDEGTDIQDQKLILMINHKGEGRSPEGSESEGETRAKKIDQAVDSGLEHMSES